METKDFCTTKELADKLRVHVTTYRVIVDAGTLKAFKLGRKFKIDKEASILF